MKNKDRRMKKTVILCCFICFTGFILLLIRFILPFSSGKTIDVVDKVMNPIEKIELSETGYPASGDGFTCTGLCYDSTEDILWVGNYGKLCPDKQEIQPSIIGISASSGVYLKEIDLSMVIDLERSNIQGVAYEEDNDSIWFTDSSSVFHIKKDGSLIEKLDLGKYTKYIPNGLVYDQYRESLWVLFYKGYLVEYDKSGRINRSYHFDFKDQDQLTIENEKYLLASVGADYMGQNNFVLRINKDTGHVECAIRAVDSFAIEGLCIVDNRLFVANDGLFHTASIKTNRILIYEIGD